MLCYYWISGPLTLHMKLDEKGNNEDVEIDELLEIETQ